MKALVVLLVGCGFSGSPPGVTPPIDAAPDPFQDAPGTGTDAAPKNNCYGPGSGQWQVCLGSAPTGDVVLTGTIDTEHDTRCLMAQPSGWYPAQPSSCFIVGGTIRIDSGVTVHVTGRKPLVLLADTTITIAGTLDAASHRGGDTGPASGSTECSAWVATPGGSGGGHFPGGGGGAGGGGAGGSFMTKGGDGGSGDQNKAKAGGAPTGGNAPAKLRGGCSGQRGYTGGGFGGPPAGPMSGGAGGGAVYLVAGTTIAVPGEINVSGAGGNGNGQHDGGDGGGSGGMIVLYAPTISAAMLVANGGGGASGGTAQQGGHDGSDGSIAASQASGGTPGPGGGGGYALALDANGGISGPRDQGGGGGGGGGGYIQSNIVLTGVCSPPATYTF